MSTIMDGWDIPDQLGEWSDWHWFKVPAGKVLKLVFLSEQPTGYVGHFDKGRMIPCLGEGCKMCHDGIGAQARYVFAVAALETRKVGLIEVSRTVALDWREVAEACGKLRGLTVAIWKKSYSKHSRMEYEYEATPDTWVIDAFEVPDVKLALKATWEKAGWEIPSAIKSYTGAKPRRPSEVPEKKKERPSTGLEEAKKRFLGAKEGQAP